MIETRFIITEYWLRENGFNRDVTTTHDWVHKTEKDFHLYQGEDFFSIYFAAHENGGRIIRNAIKDDVINVLFSYKRSEKW